MDFEKICMLFTMQEPYYGILLSSMERIPTKVVTQTLCVGRSGNVFKLYYNPDFVGKFDIDTTMQLIKHEVLHVAFNHFSIWDGAEKNDSPKMSELRNIAADLEVNSYLNRTRMDPKVGGVWAEDFGWDKMEGTREYFNRLLQKFQQPKPQPQPQAQQSNNPQKPCNGGPGGNSEEQQSKPQNSQPQNDTTNNSSDDDTQQGTPVPAQSGKSGDDLIGELPKFNTFDEHDKWPDCSEESDIEQMKQIIDDLLVFAAEEIEKSQGTIPGEMRGKIKLIRDRKKPKPVADWKRYFRRYLGNEFSEFIRKSKKRESRRFPDAAGNRHRRKSHILVAIDTSGSVSMPEYREFFGQIRTLTQTASFHVVECDARIQHEYDFNGKPNETLHGGGGTDFQPVVDYFNKQRKKYDALVYFTDGYCSIPKDTPKDTLWVVSSNGDQSDRNRYKVNGASVAFIPKKKQ